jgi:adenylate kinase family enzyme
MNRVSVIGTSGSGKTTFAAALAGALDCPHVELDQMSWDPGWRPVDVGFFSARVRQAILGARWVIDGNYSSVRPLIWSRADTVVWLDYTWPVVLSRSIRRTARRIVLGEQGCSGNRETLGRALSRDSIILWVLKTCARRRREYPLLLRELAATGVTVVRLSTPKAAAAWLAMQARGVETSRLD